MDDTISRQAALDALNEQIEQCNKALGSFDISLKDEFAIKVERASLKAYKEQLENLPTVQPKRGKWIDAVIPNDNGDLLVQVCDQCNTFFPLAYTGGGHHFCPNCGADMRGEQDEY